VWLCCIRLYIFHKIEFVSIRTSVKFSVPVLYQRPKSNYPPNTYVYVLVAVNTSLTSCEKKSTAAALNGTSLLCFRRYVFRFSRVQKLIKFAFGLRTVISDCLVKAFCATKVNPWRLRYTHRSWFNGCVYIQYSPN